MLKSDNSHTHTTHFFGGLDIELNMFHIDKQYRRSMQTFYIQLKL